MRSTIFRNMNPLKLLPIRTNVPYERLPGYESNNGSPFSAVSLKKYRWRSPSPGAERFPALVRMSLSRLIMLAVTAFLCVGLVAVGGYRGHQRMKHKPAPVREAYPWESFTRLDGFYNGVGTLVPKSEWTPEQHHLRENITVADKGPRKPTSAPPLDPIAFDPYAEYKSDKYLQDHHPVHECFLDANDRVRTPDVYAYPGLPQNSSEASFGSYDVLGIRDDVCWERFGRFGPYGYGYDREEGGLGLAEKSEKVGSGKVRKQQPKVDYRKINWGEVQRRCVAKNKDRFDQNKTVAAGEKAEKGLKKRVARQAYILRAYTGYKYDDHQLLTMRAMITELSLKTGGEYDVHLLVQVRDDSIPIWTDKEIYRKTLEESVPEEFWGIATLWSEGLMRLYYPAPFPDNFDNPSGQPIHGVYRGAHFPLFWFAQQHPEYEHYWNWEMDLRYTGHYYEFNKHITEWAKNQPRKGIWERSARYYMPELHGSWADFQKLVEQETYQDPDGPVWGPVKFPNSGMLPSPNATKPPTTYLEDNYEWGVGEDADLITFNPLFDPAKTNWVFRDDVDGFSRQHPIPPRRVAIITVSRLSKRLLDLAHKETYKMRHTMFPEMWPPTIALHHGLKAVYVPHPVYFDRLWPLEYMDQIFNKPEKPTESVFGWGEHNQLGSSFYYNSGFAGALWRRWFGYRENKEGGSWVELTTTGRLCLRSTLLHPIKFERGPTE
ncbi:hypothetical protein EJ06DRAFT_215265 [Trichodelitschia bisporula]|uniref:Uncharacterized protein n=1 Tax=Trichodelitschia bisporula TaxID=703511 RepID=A0A6G1I973_9PEZI|nr:hypothetical protein EJ06DRAFT_215265 [Trichodelitschia bisporula]